MKGCHLQVDRSHGGAQCYRDRWRSWWSKRRCPLESERIHERHRKSIFESPFFSPPLLFSNKIGYCWYMRLVRSQATWSAKCQRRVYMCPLLDYWSLISSAFRLADILRLFQVNSLSIFNFVLLWFCLFRFVVSYFFGYQRGHKRKRWARCWSEWGQKWCRMRTYHSLPYDFQYLVIINENETKRRRKRREKEREEKICCWLTHTAACQSTAPKWMSVFPGVNLVGLLKTNLYHRYL